MKKNQIFWILGIVILCSIKLFSQGNNERDIILFEKSFENNDIEMLDHFFETWENQSTPISKNELSKLSKIKKYTYSLFQTFYYPFGIHERDIPKEFRKKNSDPDSLEKLFLPYKKPEYIILQNNIYMGIVNDFKKIIDTNEFNVDQFIVSKDSILNFRPTVDVKNKKGLFIKEKYYDIFYDFVMDSLEYLARGDEKDHEMYLDLCKVADRKMDFLKSKIGIQYGHWGGIHVETLPFVHLILFNKGMWLAKVYFRETWWTGGEAYYIRIGNIWIKLYRGQTWIQ